MANVTGAGQREAQCRGVIIIITAASLHQATIIMLILFRLRRCSGHFNTFPFLMPV